MNKVVTVTSMERKKNNGILFVFILSFLLHLIPIFIIKTPTSGPDEVISLSSAAQIAGFDWSYLITKFGVRYGCGSAWFLTPLFWIISDGQVIYNLARVMLAVLLALQAVICWKILNEIFELDNQFEMGMISLTGSFFSNVTADIFCNEAMLTLSTWLFIYFLLKGYKCGKHLKFSIAIVCIFAYCCICHTRALIYLPSILIVAIYLSIKNKKLFMDYRAIIVGVGLCYIAQLINKIVGLELYNNKQAIREISAISEKQSGSLGLVNNFYLTVKEFGVWETIKGILCVSVTNVYALLIFTGFGFAVAVMSFMFFFKKKEKDYNDLLVSIISLFCIIGLCTSILAMGVIHCWHGINLAQGNLYSDGRFFFYLRYYINFLPPMVIPIYLCMRKFSTKKLITGAAIFSIALYILFETVFSRMLVMKGIEQFDVGKLFEAFSINNVISYSVAFKICLLVNVILIIVCKDSKRSYIYFGIVFLMIFYQQMYQCIFFRGSISKTTQEYTDSFVEYCNDKELRNYFDDFGKIYVASSKMYRPEYYIQLIVPEVQVRRFEENAEDMDEEKIVLSNERLDSLDGDGCYCINLDENEFIYTDSYSVYIDLIQIITCLEENK